MTERLDRAPPSPAALQPPSSGLSCPCCSGKPRGKGQLAVFLVPWVLTWFECRALPRKAWEKGNFPALADPESFLGMTGCCY